MSTHPDESSSLITGPWPAPGPGYDPATGPRSASTDPDQIFADRHRRDDDEHGELAPAELDEIVDRVVERIEQRVVDELERRGRRHTPGVF